MNEIDQIQKKGYSFKEFINTYNKYENMKIDIINQYEKKKVWGMHMKFIKSFELFMKFI
jgi:hypothetical protein